MDASCIDICEIPVTCDKALLRFHADMDCEFGREPSLNKGVTLELAEGGGECEISDKFGCIISSRGGGGSSLSLNATTSGGRYCPTSEDRGAV